MSGNSDCSRPHNTTDRLQQHTKDFSAGCAELVPRHTATDNCSGLPEVAIIEYDCFKFTKKGKCIDKTGSCVVGIDGDTITEFDSNGVGDTIT